MDLKRSFMGLLLVAILSGTEGSHYRGGIVTWRPLNNTPSGTTVQILIAQKHSWRRSYWSSTMCDDTRIAAGNLVGASTGYLVCNAGGSCGSFTSISADVVCTDYSANVGLDYSSGERETMVTLPLNRTFVLGFLGNAWMALTIGGGGDWQITGKIDLTVRPDGIINTSPVTSTLPVIYKTINIQHVHVVQMSDGDSSDILRCRWSTNNIPANWNGYDECRSVCAPTLPAGYQLFADNCTLVFTLTKAENYSAVALQIEDFYTATSPTPMSSVPIQFLFLGKAAPTGCSTAPIIIGVRPNLACIGTPPSVLSNETVIAQVTCPGKTITDFVTSSPTGLRKSAIMNPSTGIFTIVLLWTPTSIQYGPQGFCAGAVDNTGVQSDPWCITFLVGFTPPNLQQPMFVQHSASPLGTIFNTHSIFSIQSVGGVPVNRPKRNGTYIHFNDATMNNSRVLSFDCGYSSNITYAGSTIIIMTAPFLWTYGHSYYVTFDSGASSGVDFCRAESAPLTSPTFWRFNVWDPRLSSTTTASTTAPAVVTITTRGVSSTTPAVNLTTTGVIVTTTRAPSTTTVTTRSTTTLPNTTAIRVTTTTSTATTRILTPREMEEACKQPLAVTTAVTMIVAAIVNALSMFAMFTKMESMFNPQKILAEQRKNLLPKRVY